MSFRIAYEDPKPEAQWQHFNPDDMVWCQCASCAHKALNKTSAQPVLCLAYPDGVPREILANEVDHHYPHPGDHGIVYDRRAGSVIPNPFPDLE